jgi:hypothetical protein
MSPDGQAPSPPRGRLKVFIGMAAGVGKTYRMLQEGRAESENGRDVVIGYLKPHGREDTSAQAEGLEELPPRMVDYRGTPLAEMNLPAVLARAGVCEDAHERGIAQAVTVVEKHVAAPRIVGAPTPAAWRTRRPWRPPLQAMVRRGSGFESPSRLAPRRHARASPSALRSKRRGPARVSAAPGAQLR